MKRERTAYAEPASVKDKSDCSVRALAVALGITVDQSGVLFSAMGRTLGKGTETEITKRLHAKLGLIEIEVEGLDLQTFAARAAGDYVLHKKGHAFAVLGGIVHDWGEGTTKERTQLVRGWKVTPEAREKAKELLEKLGF